MLDPEFSQTLAEWQRDCWAVEFLFSRIELAQIDAARRRIRKERRTIAYCVYENAFAKAGGLVAVANRLPPSLRRLGFDVVVLSPYHRQLKTAPDVSTLNACGETTVPFDGRSVPVSLYEHRLGETRWVLFQAPGLFEAAGGPAGNNPYAYGSPGYPNAPSRLAEDSLFASAAVPYILAALQRTEDVIVHAQDWQFVATALTVKEALLDGLLNSAAVVLTSHNPYDSSLSAEQLAMITRRNADFQWPSLRRRVAAPEQQQSGNGRTQRRDTFYECMMPLLDAPLSTVSRTFARDLTAHPIQTVHFAGHLQEVFAKQQMVGIDNGLFLEPENAFSHETCSSAKVGHVQGILEEKLRARRTMLEMLEHYRPEGVLGHLSGERGAALSQLPDATPVFMMFGRLDPGQKGFDLFTRAIERAESGSARYVLAPDVGDGAEAYVDDMRRLVEARPGEVVCFTQRVAIEYYLAMMSGVSYCVMPSLYEPFGGATEPYLRGTPVVAHATGGLVQQVVDFDADRERATGVLFASRHSESSERELGLAWRRLLTAALPQERVASPLYSSLVDGLARAMRRASEVYRQDPVGYGQMLAHLYDQAMRFSWDKSAEEYAALYDAATR
jgi:starch synthase